MTEKGLEQLVNLAFSVPHPLYVMHLPWRGQIHTHTHTHTQAHAHTL